ncbi:MAG: hypothetical protein KC910_33805, partial [Candidatus Eremiobacteraeota bacterium]|nr:hypothetical protein [Candidatus Eremiobacteraeota bacterium]
VVPWSLLLLCLDSRRWFGSEWLAVAWASFDMAATAALVALAFALRAGRSWYRELARTLLGVFLADAWLSTAQALLYNVHHVTHWWEWILLAIGVSAPFLAASLLGLLLLARPELHCSASPTSSRR